MSESKKHDSLSAEELDGVAGGVFFRRDPSESFCPFCSMSTKDPKFKDTHLYLGEGWAIKRRCPPLLMPAPHAVLAPLPPGAGSCRVKISSKSPASLLPVT